MIAQRLHSLHLRVMLVAACMLVFGVAAAHGQDEQTELRSTADYIYGQSMNFHLAAANIGEVEALSLIHI